MRRFSPDPEGHSGTVPPAEDNGDGQAATNGGSAAYSEAWDWYVAGERRAAPRGSTIRVTRETLQIALVALLLFAGTRTVVQGREIRGPSMQPTYHSGQRLFVTRYFFSDPQRGDVVVFHPTSPARDDYIKRVIGVPGDHVVIHDGQVSVNGVTLDEPYIAEGVQTACAGRWCDVLLGPGEYFVMGDNRPNSSDSRMWGPIGSGQVVGKAWLLYYPFSDFGLAP